MDGDLESVEDAEERFEMVDTERSCMNCAKRNTCVIFQKASFLHPDQWEGVDEPPIRQDRFAVMCDDYEEMEE